MPQEKEQSGNRRREFTFQAVALGAILSVVMCAANAYLGLYAGMTVSASIPAAVISMAILRGVLRKGSILENNIVQTMASSGESLAAGIIFTVPALVLAGAWQEFNFWQTTFIGIIGGSLGAIFMIPLRKALIFDDKTLTYPEGVACAEVLKAGESGGQGFSSILWGIGIGGGFKFLSTGAGLLRGSLEIGGKCMDRLFCLGMDASPALLAVGYIVNLNVAILIFSGGFLAWNIGIPMLGIPSELASKPAMEAASILWKNQIRYVGVGAMIVGGFGSIFSIRQGIMQGIKNLYEQHRAPESASVDETQRDLRLNSMFWIIILLLPALFCLYYSLTHLLAISIVSTVLMTVFAFFFTAVSSYIVGLVGSSNNPVSGMTICALLGTAAFFALIGLKGDSAILATLGVAGVVCCAACSAGDMSQDLKTGSLVGSSPRYQQIAQFISVAIPAFVLAPILSLLHSAYGIGQKLQAPQATLFASITQSIFGKGSLPKNMIYIGMMLGLVIIAIDLALKKRKCSFRLHLMPVAVGIYLPISLAVPILLGGVCRFLSDRSKNQNINSQETIESEPGILLASGLIAGEAMMGIVLAIFIYMNVNLTIPVSSSGWISNILQFLTLGIILAIGWGIMQARRSPTAREQ
jgi:putative OPT family oligopeptide transporter